MYSSMKNSQNILQSQIYHIHRVQYYLLLEVKRSDGWRRRTNGNQIYLSNTLCPLCERKEDTQHHVISCNVLQYILSHNILPQEKHLNSWSSDWIHQNILTVSKNTRPVSWRVQWRQKPNIQGFLLALCVFSQLHLQERPADVTLLHLRPPH